MVDVKSTVGQKLPALPVELKASLTLQTAWSNNAAPKEQHPMVGSRQLFKWRNILIGEFQF